MNKIHEWVNTGLIACLFVSVLLVGGNNQSAISPDNSLGGAGGTRFPHGVSVGTNTLPTGSGFLIGTTGTEITRFNSGTCYFNPTATTMAASTTVDIDCQATAAVGVPNSLTASALTGVTSGDKIQITLSTSTAAYNGTTATTGGGLIVVGASASTTPGYIRLRLFNAMGTTYTYPVQAVGGVNASGTASYIAIP